MLCNPFPLSSCSIHTSPPTNQNLLQGLYAISNWNIAKTLNHCPHWFRPLNRQRSPFKEASAESSPLWLTSVIKIPCERVCQITISLSLLFPIKTHKILLVLSVTSLLLFSRPSTTASRIPSFSKPSMDCLYVWKYDDWHVIDLHKVGPSKNFHAKHKATGTLATWVCPCFWLLHPSSANWKDYSHCIEVVRWLLGYL